MKKFNFLLVAFFLFASIGRAQIAAGVSDGLMIGQEGIQLNVAAFNFGDFIEKFDSLDFNKDGQYDANFTAQAANITDFTGAGTGLLALHSRFEMLVDSNAEIILLALGDSITATQRWSNSSNGNLYFGAFNSSFWGIGGHFAFGNWFSGQSAFAGFRVLTAAPDTLYGWMYVSTWVNPNSPSNATLAINSAWAIQFASSSSVADEPFVDQVSVFPNPVHDVVEFKRKGQNLEDAVLRLFDLQGNLLREADASGEKTVLHLNDLPAGIFVWELRAKAGCQRGKFVKAL